MSPPWGAHSNDWAPFQWRKSLMYSMKKQHQVLPHRRNGFDTDSFSLSSWKHHIRPKNSVNKKQVLSHMSCLSRCTLITEFLWRFSFSSITIFCCSGSWQNYKAFRKEMSWHTSTVQLHCISLWCSNDTPSTSHQTAATQTSPRQNDKYLKYKTEQLTSKGHGKWKDL